jgi:hypothetical protein
MPSQYEHLRILAASVRIRTLGERSGRSGAQSRRDRGTRDLKFEWRTAHVCFSSRRESGIARRRNRLTMTAVFTFSA